ncbi:Translation initiation factor eIF-2B subunit beta [Blyttiomyces sp. JEL0837]|nr:Translation initiation factor eIF-2B subunit beta [Blyttiomyces sp. JEL0837]
MSAHINALAEKLRRRQIVGSFQCARETAKTLKVFVKSCRWNDVEGLMAIVKEKGRQLVDAQPIEISVDNVVKRVLALIREEDYNLKNLKEASTFTPQVRRQTLQNNVAEAIQELLDEYESSAGNIASQALDHIHSNEIIMTLGKSIAVERFLKEAAKHRKFQVMVAETSPR